MKLEDLQQRYAELSPSLGHLGVRSAQWAGHGWLMAADNLGVKGLENE